MRRTIPLLLATTLLASPAIAQEKQASSEGGTIVVTGKRIEDSARALEDCLARGCPPEEDIALSLEHAENQFLEGSYSDGNRTLRASIKRTDDHADRLPIPVASLYRASARLSEHMGEGKDFQLSTLDMRDTLKNGLGRDHWRSLAADITVGDSRAKLGQPDDAERIYKRVERRAVDLGQPRVAMFARVRLALLDEARHQATKRDFYREDAVERLIDIRDNPLPGGEEFSLVASVMLAKFDREAGSEDSTEALIEKFALSGGVERPVLLFSDPLYTNEDLDRERGRAGGATARLSTLSRNEPQWADVGFWITEDGRVEDYEILRSKGDTGWLGQVERHIKSRRYAPLKQTDAVPTFFMIERYTLTARYASSVTGTRLRKREPVMRIERLDITPENFKGQDGESTSS